ncbi:hypothetical protein [Paracoccus benzoatiresistens]|uniref:Uncharacterized protein n=1 Tax=Paracoccus benzoatiresistens TaxID=2997341 RepID=A0ABT4J6J3_9RHOB|nr:hypothetical protein [Paracoccus sp. EF6]MCZ0962066.1 hypothetical protein [Paracoccus sp. EF6]
MIDESFEAIGRNFAVALALEAAFVLALSSFIGDWELNDPFLRYFGSFGLIGFGILGIALHYKATYRLADYTAKVLMEMFPGPIGKLIASFGYAGGFACSVAIGFALASHLAREFP